jgi:hypothetical protein
MGNWRFLILQQIVCSWRQSDLPMLLSFFEVKSVQKSKKISRRAAESQRQRKENFLRVLRVFAPLRDAFFFFGSGSSGLGYRNNVSGESFTRRLRASFGL